MLSLALAAPILVAEPPAAVERIAFASCAYSRMPDHRGWQSIHALEPDLVVLHGDNVYGDTEEPEVLRRTLNRLGRRRRFRRMARDIPLMFTWDDHDFGGNDSDSRHKNKHGVRHVTLDFFGVPADDPRRTQEGGIYTARRYGTPGRRVQVVMLDTRWDLSPRLPRTDGGIGRYRPGAGFVLGPQQWGWLMAELRKPAELRIIVSSIPFAPEYTGWETWANFPSEQRRLVDLLKRSGPTLVVSGDVHYAEISSLDGVVDFTTSGLAGHAYPPQPNAHRVDGLAHHGNNFGMVEVDWGEQQVQLLLRDRKGEGGFEKSYSFEELDP